MAYYQSTDLFKEFQFKGSFKVEYAPYVVDHSTATWVELGMADNVSFVEQTEFLDGQASNSSKPKILTGIAKQTLNIGFELWMLDIVNTIVLRGGIDTVVTNAVSTTAGQTQVYTGGKSETTPIMLRITNRMPTTATANDVTQYTGIVGLTAGDAIYRDISFIAFKCDITSGNSITGKNDADTDSALRFPYTFVGLEDVDRPVGKQLSVIERKISLIA